MEAARQLEASFLAEMLKQAGFADGRSAFGGGAGEQQFSSFLLDEYAKKIVSSGGIGLAEKIFQHLHART
ncbi:MAG: rod-binding protein [Pseudomonadota bacterium]